MDKVAVLKRSYLFESFEDAILTDLSRIVQEEHFSKKEVVFHEAEIGDKLYIVADGIIEIIKDYESEDNYLLAVLNKDDFFGEMALIDSEPRSATAVAIEDTTLLSIAKNEFDSFINETMSPAVQILLRISHVMSNRIRHANELFRSLIHMSLDEASKRKSEMNFLSMISHELRTPLYLIQGFLSVLHEDGIDEESREEAIQVILNEGNRLSRMINNLVLFSQLEYSGTSVIRKSHDIVGLIREVAEDYEKDAKEYQIEIQLNLPSDSLLLSIDEKRMKQVVANLLDNGIKYSKSDGGKIIVKLVEKMKLLELYFKDDGIGIPAKDLPQIFNRFFQTNLMSRRAATGAGIGLAICKEIVESHGGVITVKSTENKGSEFLVRLPKN